jgi:hypothetical protein
MFIGPQFNPLQSNRPSWTKILSVDRRLNPFQFEYFPDHVD